MNNFFYPNLYFLLLVFPFTIRAQAPEPQERNIISVGGSVSSGVSYTGLGVTAGISLKKKSFEVIVGPRFSLTDTYRLASGPWGGAASLYYYLTYSANNRLKSFANLDYQNLVQRPYGEPGNQRNIIQEVSLGYGLNYRLKPGLAIFNAINVGFYQESLHNSFRNERFRIRGLNILVKLGLIYYFRHDG